ncbi:restriction endonuclease subunit S [Lentilactobacillus parafarraginis]|uniref:Restriction endonuclease subunit S n=1 Tax=Lentilactobacillus parafarraginis TaxID=390842 RepID=A0A5R9CRA4_9LACO|nr:restriction endonuclease subunit S [Lentilactobacillus parafarraginis]TLQ17872.1 restriction endonuclease subunit S [Lentilactobacillus parafarraginis]
MNANQAKYPQLRFKGFTDPWEQRKLSEIYDKIRNAFVGTATPYYVNQGHFYLESNNVKYGKLNFNNEVYINDDFYQKQKPNWLHTGDLVVVQSGHVGHSAVIPSELNNTAAHAVIIVAKPKQKIDPYFINDYLQTNIARKQIDNITTGNTIKHILASAMKMFEVSLPSYEEQRPISNLLAQIDDTITLHQRKLAKLKELKQGYLQKMFPQNGSKFPQLRFAGFADAWEQRKLGKMGYTFTGLSGKTKEDFGHGNAKFVTYMNVFSSPVSNSEMVENVEVDSKQHQVEYGDVFFTTSSETPQEVGMSSVWLETAENIYLNSFCFGYHPMVEFDPYYLAFMLRSPVIRKKFMLLAQGISRYNISKNKVMEMLVPVPEIVEQQKIGSFFKQLDDTITLHQRKLEKLQELKKGYLQKMFC